MTHIVTVTNNKGGVGKTSTVFNLGAGLALQGKKTLLIDLDAQANLSLCFGRFDENRVGEVLTNGMRFEDAIVNTRENLDILPTAKDLLAYEGQLFNKMNRERVLAKILSKHASSYDYVLIDTPPTLNLLTNNALFASTAYIVPMEAEYFAFDGIVTLINHVNEIAEDTGIEFAGVVLTCFNEKQRDALMQHIAGEIKKEPAYRLFNTIIRKHKSVSRSPIKQQSVFEYDGEGNGAQDYMSLTLEAIARYEQ